jgi:ABC-type sulfate/molybdate transport systems ATPase subunit
MSEKKTLKGYVVFVTHDQGSKNEHFAPILLVEQAKTIRLQKEGDNQFMSESIKPFHLKYCVVTGNLNTENNVLSVSKIEEHSDIFLDAIGENKEDSDVVQKKEENANE